MDRSHPYLADHYARKAKKEGYAARSVYKLQAIDQKHRLLHSGQRILDLGAAPGSWVQYAAARCGKKGLVLGVDLQPPPSVLPAQARWLTADIFTLSPETLKERYGTFHVLLSDLAPKTSGIKHVDSMRSAALAEHALLLADQLLERGGSLVIKLLQGKGIDAIHHLLSTRYRNVTREKPAASRSHSREYFLVGIHRLH